MAIIAATEIAARALRAVGVNPATIGTGSGGFFSLADIATAALRKLAVVDPSEAPAAADQAHALARATSVSDLLVALDYANWSAAAIPSAVAEYYIIMTANLIAPAFGKPAAAEAFAAAQEQIRLLALVGPIAQSRAEALVLTVHDRLTAEAMADWDYNAIPDAFGGAYAQMVAYLLAPTYGKPAEPGMWADGIAQVRRMVLSGLRGQSLAADKVAEVHEALNALGLVTWPVSGVPLGQAEAYVQMTAVLLAPIFGLQTEPAARAASWEAAQASVRRAAVIRGAQARAIDNLSAAQAELNALGLISWTTDAIPAAMGEALAAMVVSMMGVEFGREPDPKLYAMSMDRVRRISMGGPAGQALAEQKVRAVHQSLVARGRINWGTVYDIPVYAEEDYVLLAAVLLAPECGVKADPSWGPMAERDLAQVVALPANGEPVRAVYF